MRISLQQAADILNRSVDEVLYIANNESRLSSFVKPDNDMIYRDDGTVSFVEGDSEPTWEFELEDVLEFKKQMDNELAGELEEILEER